MPTIKHAKQVDLIAHPPDGASVVQFDDWNEEHEIEQETGRVLGRASPGSGPTEELTPSQARGLLELGNAATKNTGTGANDVAAGNHSHANATTSAHGFMSSTDKQKIDGVEAGAQVNLAVGTSAGTVAAGNDSRITGAQQKSEKDQPNGYAGLDAAGKLAESQLPAVAITDTFVVNNQAAMLALTVQRGDIAVRTDLNKSFVLQTAPGSVLANWVELRTPTDAVLSVAGKTGAVTLAKGDVGLGNVDNTSDVNKPVSTATQNALNGKANSSHTHTKSQITDFAHTHSAADLTDVGAEIISTSDPSGSPVNGTKWFKV